MSATNIHNLLSENYNKISNNNETKQENRK